MAMTRLGVRAHALQFTTMRAFDSIKEIWKKSLFNRLSFTILDDGIFAFSEILRKVHADPSAKFVGAEIKEKINHLRTLLSGLLVCSRTASLRKLLR